MAKIHYPHYLLSLAVIYSLPYFENEKRWLAIIFQNLLRSPYTVSFPIQKAQNAWKYSPFSAIRVV